MKLNQLAAVLAALIFGGLVLAQTTTDSGAENYFLANKFAPNFLFDSQEKFFPCDYSQFFYDASREEIRGSLAVNKYQELLPVEKLSHFQIYYNVKKLDNNQIAIQYWQFYVFNDFLNRHFGDAEVFTAFVDANTGQAIKFIGSAHIGSESKIIAANNEIDGAGKTHVNVLIENGSHAIFPDANGNRLADPQELANWYNAYGIIGWDENDVANGQKVYYGDTYYKMSPISDLEDKLSGRLPILESGDLGIFIPLKIDLGFVKIDEEITLPFGGQSVFLENIGDRLTDPQKVEPLELTETTTTANKNVAKISPDVLGASIKEISEDAPKKVTRTKTPTTTKTTTIKPLLISELCAGVGSASNEYVTIYNPNEVALDLSENFELKIANSSGKLSDKRLKFSQEKIAPKGYFLLAPKDVQVGSNKIDTDGTYSSSISGIGCAQICLADSCDTLSFGEASLACSAEKFFFVGGGLKTNYCLRRKSSNYSLLDSNDNQADFSLVEQACPKNSKGEAACISPEDKTESKKTIKTAEKKTVAGGEPTEKTLPLLCDLKINEVMYNADGSDTSKEWIEIYNASPHSCNLEDYSIKINDSNHRIYGASSTAIIASNDYALISSNPATFKTLFTTTSEPILKSAISLTNNVATIYLLNDNITINSFAYSSSSGAYGNGLSLQLINGTWQESWPTPNEPNILRATSLATSSQSAQLTLAEQATSTPSSTVPKITYNLRINEIMYDALGSDSQKEWLEIYNAGQTINIESCKIVDLQSGKESSHSLYFLSPTSSLESNQFAVVLNDKDSTIFYQIFPNFNGMLLRSNFTLPNTTQKIALQCEDAKIDEKTYLASEGGSGNGLSLQYFSDSWQEAEPTPGAENLRKIAPTSSIELPSASSSIPTSSNIFPTIEPPIANFNYDFKDLDVNFNASSSSCATGTIVQYEWNFDTNANQITPNPTISFQYQNSGQYNVSLIVTDSNGLKSTPFSQTITVIDPDVIIKDGPQI